ncbi:DUF1572 family protein [Parafilimonas sp.]|uniref:DUF1572 family protein n=1 Tax=Parafilimonas sp. TaxID=1969739 RepID=UPI003F7FE307
MNIEEAFLQSAIKKFKAQKLIGDKTLTQLDEKDFFFKPSAESNSIAIIVQHMSGNMLSRWTDFLTEDGEKPWRERDVEFENTLSTKEDVLNAWNKGWACVLGALENLKPEDVMKTITIRSEPHLVIDAVIRQIDHYGGHTAQIVYIGKLIKNETWQSLSIPKNKSKAFNEAMNHKI